jgi:hypothetical protein
MLDALLWTSFPGSEIDEERREYGDDKAGERRDDEMTLYLNFSTKGLGLSAWAEEIAVWRNWKPNG